MKKLLAIVVLSLLLSSNANAKILNPYTLDMKDFWKKMNNTESRTTDLIGYDRWYALNDDVVQIDRVEIKDTNNRYVMIPKLADAHKLLRNDTDDNNTNWENKTGEDDSLT